VKAWESFRDLWVVDFEFQTPVGDPQVPVCLVAHEIRSGRTLRVWQDELAQLAQAPYNTGDDSLLIAYVASAELGCHLALGWELPSFTLDLFAEFRTTTNGKYLPAGRGLLGAAVFYGLDAMSAARKDAMRELVLRGGPWSEEERNQVLDYCESDVITATKVLRTMEPNIDLPRALLRGRFMRDVAAHDELVEYWPHIQDELINRVDRAFGVYEGRTFKLERFARYLEAQKIPWPRTASGRLSLEDDVFRDQVRAYPQLSPLRELRASLSQLRLSGLTIGKDGRNRTPLWSFAAKTGRNQPSNAKFIFGPSVWLRSLIKPPPGRALAYLDYSQQEFAIAAVLSGDANMLAAYSTGDAYLEFAKQAGAVPPDGTKESHGAVREQFKTCALGVNYGMEENALADRIGSTPVHARDLLAAHRRTYRTFWRWSDGVVDFAMLHGKIWTVFGWTLQLDATPNVRSLRNFPMQANGAEMLRLACCLATERGITVCAPVHDAMLIEASTTDIDEAVAKARQAMQEAAYAVLGGTLGLARRR